MSAAQPPDILSTRQERNLYIISLTRIDKRNAINDEMVRAIERVFSSIPNDVRAIILTGEGEHFSAGLDLSELRERDAFEGAQHSRMWHRATQSIQFAPVPVVAALHGAVVGGGFELAAAAHIRVADPSTFFAMPEGQRGIFVGGGASVNVARLIGTSRMMDMMLTGRVLNAEDAEAIGLVQYLVDEGKAMDKAAELATKIAANAPVTNYAITHVLPRIAEMSQDQGLLMESLIAGIAQSAPEAKNRIQDFLEKRAKKVGE